jgi:hypothetical protein
VYFNALYDTYYISGGSMSSDVWEEYKILIDLLIKLNTTRPLRPSVQSQLDVFYNIRYLTVDLHIFGTFPSKIRTAFFNLEVLTIPFYPYPEIKGIHGGYIPSESTQFIKPQRGSKFGKRANWIRNYVYKSLQISKITCRTGRCRSSRQ